MNPPPGTPALFVADGTDTYVATEFARGPWDPRHCHGGPVSALLARACERIDDGGDTRWQIARLTIELTRPVPVGESLHLATEVERPGRKVSLVGATLTEAQDDGRVVARVRALRVRHQNMSLPEHPTAPPELSGSAGDGRRERVTWAVAPDSIAFHSHGAEHRIVDGGWDAPGPIKLWIRLLAHVVDGEDPTGTQRAAAAADFGNGVSSALDFNDFAYINPDLTVHLARPPAGEWIGMSTHSVYGVDGESTGLGYAESALHDSRGRVGRSVQSLLLEPR